MKMIHDSRFTIHEKRKGFTLIELLVVISIISILTAVATVSFTSVRQRSRDGVRKSDLKQIQAALELYRSSQGQYPAAVSCKGQIKDPASGTVYMNSVPCDPGSGTYTYTPSCGGAPSICSGYTMSATLENTNDPDCPPTRGTSCTYTVQNP